MFNNYDLKPQTIADFKAKAKEVEKSWKPYEGDYHNRFFGSAKGHDMLMKIGVYASYEGVSWLVLLAELDRLVIELWGRRWPLNYSQLEVVRRIKEYNVTDFDFDIDNVLSDMQTLFYQMNNNAIQNKPLETVEYVAIPQSQRFEKQVFHLQEKSEEGVRKVLNFLVPDVDDWVIRPKGKVDVLERVNMIDSIHIRLAVIQG